MRIAYVGPFEFPASSANSLRVKGVAQALADCGAQVTIYAGISAFSAKSRSFAENIQYRGVGEYERGMLSNVKHGLRGLVMGDGTVAMLEGEIRCPDAVIVYGTHLGYLLRLISYCKRHRVSLFVDAVEWYDPRHLPGGVLGPFALANEISMRWVARQADGLFVISRYLQDHFSKNGQRTLRLPPLFPKLADRFGQFRHQDQRLHLCYSGAPGKKEDFLALFHGLQIARDQGLRFFVHMLGMTQVDIETELRDPLNRLSAESCLRFYGRVDNEVAQQIVGRCDFTILLRADRRVTRAGFPSKVAESFRLGTPVLANLTSNLDEYLTDGLNAVVVDDCTADAVVTALWRAVSLSDEKLSEMKMNAYRSGKQFFSIEAYQSEIVGFLNQVCHAN